jgi:hypothetical protein
MAGGVAQVLNPSYLGGRIHQDNSLRPAPAKVIETLSQQISQAWWHPSYLGGVNRRITI